LTDFDTVDDLNRAFIVCVSPTNDPPLKIVAHNILDFLAMVVKTKNAQVLDYFSLEKDRFAENAYEEGAHVVALELSKRLTLPHIGDIRTHIRDVQKHRDSLLSLRTSDGLGIRRTARSTTKSARDYVYDLDEGDVEKMRHYLHNASYDEKLAFVREANFRYVLTSLPYTFLRG
jgi:hypothetical protein